jgi:tRNA(fMet)-specific endonuclease VapC
VTLRYLLDTSIVSSPVSREPDPEIVMRLKEHGEESAIAAPVWHELKYGCERLPRGKRRTALEAYQCPEKNTPRELIHKAEGF